MSAGGADSADSQAPASDGRRIDPETDTVREESGAGPGPAQGEPASEPGSATTAEDADGAAASTESDGPDTADQEPSVDGRVAELTADLQRERAQFANYRRRAAEEKQGSVAYGKQILIDKLLPVLDDLNRAREHGDLDDSPLRSVADKLENALTAEGLAAFGAPGDVFDPELHEAVQHDGTGAEPVIGAVYRCGYRLGERVIRTAMVTVTDPVDAPTEQSAAGDPPETGASDAQ